MGAVVTDYEKDRTRHHLGYLGVEAVSTFALGVPAAMQTTFMIEGAMVRLLPEAVERFRSLLCQLDAVESEVFCGMDLASVNKLDTIEINPKRLSELAKYYKIAQQGLANLLGCPANPFDMREWLKGGINVPVL